MISPAAAALPFLLALLLSADALAEEPAAAPPATVPHATAATPESAPLPELKDRVHTSDGREHTGQLVESIDGGFVFRNHAGDEYVIPIAQIVSVERGVPLAAAAPRATPVLELEPSQRALERSFEIYSLEQRRERLSYGEKLLVMGLGAATAAIGFGLVPGETGTALGVVGAAGLTGGAIATLVTWVRERSLDSRIEAMRER